MTTVGTDPLTRKEMQQSILDMLSPSPTDGNKSRGEMQKPLADMLIPTTPKDTTPPKKETPKKFNLFSPSKDPKKSLKTFENKIKILSSDPEKAKQVFESVQSIQSNEIIQKNVDNAGSLFTAIGGFMWFVVNNKECFGITGNGEGFVITIYIMFSLSITSSVISSLFEFLKIKASNDKHLTGRGALILLHLIIKSLFFILWGLTINYETKKTCDTTQPKEEKCNDAFKITMYTFLGLIILYSMVSWIYFKESTAGNIAELFGS